MLVSSYVKAKDTDYAIMIHGDWGCGKTYYIENELVDIIKETQSSKKMLYVSLYGIQSIEEIDTRILNSVSGVYRFANALKPMIEVASDLSEIFCKPLSSIKNLVTSQNISDISNFLNKPENYVYVFDDLERIGKIDTKDVLSYINDFCEHKKCKVIVVCNEEKSNDLKEFKEKTVRFSVHLQCDINKVFDNFIKKYKEEYLTFIKNNKEFICNIFHSSGCNNLRTLSFVLDILEGLYNAAQNNKYKNAVVQQFVCFVVIYSIEYKEGQSKENLDSLDKFIYMFGYTQKNEGENIYLKKIKKRYERFSSKFRYFVVVANYILSGILDETVYHELIENLTKEQKGFEETEEGIVCRQISSASMPEKEFTSCIQKFHDFLKDGKYKNYAPSFLLKLYGNLLEFEEYEIEDFVVTEEFTNLFKREIEQSDFIEKSFYWTPSLKQEDRIKKFEDLQTFTKNHNEKLKLQEEKKITENLLSAIDTKDLSWFHRTDVWDNMFMYKYVDVNVLFEKLVNTDIETIEKFVDCFRNQFDGHIKYEPEKLGQFVTEFEKRIGSYITGTTKKTLRFRYLTWLHDCLLNLMQQNT